MRSFHWRPPDEPIPQVSQLTTRQEALQKWNAFKSIGWRRCSGPLRQRTSKQGDVRNCRYAFKEEGRPSRWKYGLARSFMHFSRPSQYALPLGISLAMGLKKEGRSVWLMATLGPLDPGVKRDSYGAPSRMVQRSVD